MPVMTDIVRPSVIDIAAMVAAIAIMVSLAKKWRVAVMDFKIVFICLYYFNSCLHSNATGVKNYVN